MAARARPATIGTLNTSRPPMNGSSVRRAAAPVAAAAKMTRLRRMMAAGDCPRDTNTTSVAPISPANAKSCQAGRFGAELVELVEVSELIFEAGAELGIDRGRCGRGGLATRPAPRRDADTEEGH